MTEILRITVEVAGTTVGENQQPEQHKSDDRKAQIQWAYGKVQRVRLARLRKERHAYARSGAHASALARKSEWMNPHAQTGLCARVQCFFPPLRVERKLHNHVQRCAHKSVNY
eukprot:4195071-Pleurochrysis_carterae.AAC.1